MFKIGEFIYPWGSGHYSRMMRFDAAFTRCIKEDIETHYVSKSHVYEKLLKKFPKDTKRIHNILMPTPIDGRFGPSVSMSLANVLLPVSCNPPIVTQIIRYLKEEKRLYDTKKFDLVINDGDMGSNILARNRKIPSLFITNQFKPRLYRSRSYLYPALIFVAKQIAKASRILVADSPPPYTICEYNLNFTKEVRDKVIYVGHFTDSVRNKKGATRQQYNTDLQKLLVKQEAEFGYWMRTGNKSTNDGTGERYEKAFSEDEMKQERRIVSHARNDPRIDAVTGKDGKRYTIPDALEKRIEWIQIDVGFLSEYEKDTVLDLCKYAVVNGSHTVMGEIMGGKAKPIVGVPIYDEHTNNIKWADQRKLGVLVTNSGNAKSVVAAIKKIKEDYTTYKDNLLEFSKGFDPGGAERAAKIATEILEE